MKKVMKWIMALLEWVLRFLIARKNIAIRFLFSIFYFFLLGGVGFALAVLMPLQFVILVITTRQVGAIKSLCHKLTVYAYKLLRYATLNENQRPFPFGKMPLEMEPAEEVDLSTPLPEKPIVDKASSETPPKKQAEASDLKKKEEAQAPLKTEASDPIILGHEEE